MIPLPLAILGALLAADPASHGYTVEVAPSIVGPADYYFMQTRAAFVPGEDPRVVMTTQEIEKSGAHGFRDVFQTRTYDGGQTWSPPQRIESLNRARQPDGYDVVIGDLMPQWHAATRKVLATGKTFNFADGVKENRGREKVSYSVYSPETDSWSGLNLVELPPTDHEGKPFSQPNSGCCQRWDLPSGEILLPIRYCKTAGKLNYTTIVARCTFDGRTLKYVEHGSELGHTVGRGLYEPSLVGLGGKFYLTLRGDASAFVARSNDGLNYEPIVEWKYDDGTVLGSYNTQQHWVRHGDDLYLVYTRRGANNDHVFRHRAPLFIAKVDPEKLCIVRATEQILIPENDADLGNFGVVDVAPNETWVIASEQLATSKKRQKERNQTWIAKIHWSEK
jgi:hypothetical protein